MQDGRADSCHAGHRILVVDDSRSIREPLVTALEGRGFDARGVGNGREALQALRDGFDACLILLDVTMPIMDGWTFRAMQQADPRLSEIPVVVLSAISDATRDAEKMGALAGLAKPIDLERLVELVSQHCPRSARSRLVATAGERAARGLRPRPGPGTRDPR